MERLWSFDWDTVDSWIVIPGDIKGRGWAKAIRFEFLPSGKRLCFSGGGFHKLHACHRVLEELYPSLHRFAILYGTSVFVSIECHPASVLQNHRLYSSFIIYSKWTISIYSWRGFLSFIFLCTHHRIEIRAEILCRWRVAPSPLLWRGDGRDAVI